MGSGFFRSLDVELVSVQREKKANKQKTAQKKQKTNKQNNKKAQNKTEQSYLR